MKKILPLLFSIFCSTFISAQTTYDFSSGSVLSSGPGGFGIWNTQADITIGGVAYTLTSGGNGSFTNQATGGLSNSKCLRKDGSGGDQFVLSRTDGQPFQFYGIWIKHQSMNSYAAFMSLPPFYNITYITPDGTDPSYTDNTAMQGGQFTTSSTAITNNITVTSVQISFNAIMYYWIDNIIVGPAAGSATTITGQPSNSAICAASNTIFSVTATNATAYQWQINSGAGFTNISNTSPYSGASTSSLSITGATSAMNGYAYRCVASGSGTANSNSATLTVSSIAATSSQVNLSCNSGSNGSATISTPTGGTAPYTYNWTPGNPIGDGTKTVSGLTAGAWMVTVTDNAGCSLIKNFTLTQPAAITASTSKTDVACNGGSNGLASVNASGGTAPYSYSWAPSGGTAATASGLVAGTYSCTITDANQCSILKTITITQPAPALPSFSAQPQSQTAGPTGNASFIVTAVNATSFQWQVNTGAGFVNISDGGVYSGSTTASLTITSATTAMNGYLYRCVIGSLCTANVNSNSAQLTTKSNNAWLSAIGITTGTLSPVFSSQSFIYNLEVPSNSSSLDLSPQTSDQKASVTVNGQPLQSGSATVLLEGGVNAITIVCTAEDGQTTHQYTLNVLRPFVSVVSLVRANGQYTNQATCTYTLKFSGTVNNLHADNFTLSATASLSGYSIQGISQTASDTYNITVNTGEGNGTLGLDLVNGQGLSAPFNSLPYLGTEQYIVDKTNPQANAQNISVTLGADGKAVIAAININNGSTDNVTPPELLNYVLSKTIFTSADLGENMITFTVTDQAGNSTEKQVTVLVQKNINSITSPQPVTFIYGETPVLPALIGVTYSDLSTENIAVNWNMQAFTGKAGQYILEGITTLSQYTTNTESLSVQLTLQVSKRPLTVQLTGTKEKIYDGNATATLDQANYSSNKLQQDSITFNSQAVYDNKNVGAEKNIVASEITISGQDAENYSLENQTSNANIGNIVARSLEISLVGRIEKIYDARKTASLSPGNFQSNALQGDSLFFTAYAEYDNKFAGENKTVTASDFFVSGLDAANYSLTTGIAQATGTILRKQITADASAAPLITKVYDASVAATLANGNYSLQGVIEGDNVQVLGTASYDNRNVGSNKAITINGLGLSGTAKDNYALTTSTLSTAGEITGKLIEVSFIENAGVSKIYDGNMQAAIDKSIMNINGIVGEDLVTLIAPAIGTYDNKDAGNNKLITISELSISGNDASNYILDSAFVSGLIGVIVPKNITVAADAKTKVYGANDPQLTFQVNGLVGNDKLTGSLSRESGRQVGSYSIQQGNLTGGTDYAISAFVPAALSITPADLTIVADDKNRKQGTGNPVLTVNYSGLVTGDSPADLSAMPVISCEATNRSPIGYYDIIVSGAASKNYNISYVKGKLTILPSDNVAGSVKAWSSAPGTIEVRVYAETEQDATITLYTEIGQAIVIHQKHLNAGINHFTLPSAKLASSTYVLSVWAKKFKKGQRVQVK